MYITREMLYQAGIRLTDPEEERDLLRSANLALVHRIGERLISGLSQESLLDFLSQGSEREKATWIRRYIPDYAHMVQICLDEIRADLSDMLPASGEL